MNRLPVIVRQHIAGFRILLVFTVICGFVYPLVMLGISQAAFHNKANGSLVSYNGHVVGSGLLCQEFVDAKGNPLPQYFQPRPSDAVVSGDKNDYGCDPLYSSASNLGPTNPAQIKLIQQRQKQIAAFDHVPISQIPADAVTASALREEAVPGTSLTLGDYVVVEAGQVIPGDGDVVQGVASVDESAITGESAPVIRESGGDRSAVTGGTTVLSDRIVVKITSKPGETFIDRMIALVEGAKRQKTPNEIALNILLAALTIIFMLAVISLQPMAFYSKAPQTLVILVALLVALIPTTIGALLSAIGIAGMDRLVQRNVLAMSGRAVEAAGDVNTLLLDKTGTITIGNRQATEFLPVGGATAAELADAAQLSSMADYTPEGRSIAVLAKNQYGLRERAEGELAGAEFVEFSAQTRMSGIDLADGRQVRKGAAARSSSGSATAAAPCPTTWARWSTASRRPAEPRWWWPRNPSTGPPGPSASSS